LGAKLLARLRLRVESSIGVLWKPWLLCSIEEVYFFGGARDVEFMFHYWG